MGGPTFLTRGNEMFGLKIYCKKVVTLQVQLAFAVLHSVPLELGGARFVLPEYLHEGARGEPKCGRRGFRVAVLGRHDIEYVGDEQRKLRVAWLDMPVASRKFHFDIGGCFADVQRKSHLHAVQRMNFVFFCAPAFGRLYF